MLKRLWLDEGGAILSAELCLIMVLLVIGMVVGLTALRDAVDFQLADIAAAIAAIDPSYEWSGLSFSFDASGGNGTQHAWVAGSHYNRPASSIHVNNGVITVLQAATVGPKL